MYVHFKTKDGLWHSAFEYEVLKKGEIGIVIDKTNAGIPDIVLFNMKTLGVYTSIEEYPKLLEVLK